eukprot:scaffold978_cov164-Amphora_coffeaeformis.AAC.5
MSEEKAQLANPGFRETRLSVRQKSSRNPESANCALASKGESRGFAIPRLCFGLSDKKLANTGIPETRLERKGATHEIGIPRGSPS